MEKQIFISGEIGWDDNESTAFADRLAKVQLKDGDTLRAIINSEGGSVFDGFDIFNQLKSLDNKVVTEVRGMAASIAALIMLAGDEIEISQAAMVMIHRSMTMAMGNSEDIEKQTNVLNKIDSVLTTLFATKTGKSEEEVEELLSNETWFTGEEAVDQGLADTLINTVDARLVALLSLNHKQKQMKIKEMLAKLTNSGEAVEETVEETTAVETTSAEETSPVKNITEEEWDIVISALQALQEALAPVEEEVEGAPAEEEEAPAEEEEESAVLTEQEIQDRIEDGIASAMLNLKRSNKLPAKGNNSMTGSPKGWVDPHAKFRAEQKELERKTRL